MIDFGFDKIALIGAVALIVIGPEKLPRVARTIGHFIGKAQRYVSDVKAEVNRSIELEELKKMKTEFEDAARNVERNVSDGLQQTSAEFDQAWKDTGASAVGAVSSDTTDSDPAYGHAILSPPVPDYKRPRKNWRLKRGATPQWYKQRNGVRNKAQSGAARVARFRPPSART
jgi:sec-independent protein translocase protein TatB